jgi:hypothetical protein
LGNGGEAYREDQDLFYVTANEHARRNFWIGRAVYKSKTTAVQPASPVENDCYVLPASPTGAQWTGHAHQGAGYDGAGWIFWSLDIGYTFSVLDEGTNHKIFTKTTSAPAYAELHNV